MVFKPLDWLSIFGICQRRHRGNSCGSGDAAELQDPSALKDKANALFKAGDVAGAIKLWYQSLSTEDVSLKQTLRANLALGHLKLGEFEAALQQCNEKDVVKCKDVKILHRRAEALAGLRRWDEAEVALKCFEDAGGSAALAKQARLEWERSRLQQKKMAKAATRSEKTEVKSGKTWSEEEGWAAPKLELVKVFDLRKVGVDWYEKDDFNDDIWLASGASYGQHIQHYPLAAPLSLLTASVLAKLSLEGTVVLHILHSSVYQVAHDWSGFLTRCPGLRKLYLVYICLCDEDQAKKEDVIEGPVPFGNLTVPVEEAKVDDRVVVTSKFRGPYPDFLMAAASLPEVCSPDLVFIGDVALAGKLCHLCLQVFTALRSRGSPPVIVTQPADVKEKKMPANTQRSMALFRLLGAKTILPWVLNRFAVPLRRVEQEGDKNGVSWLSAHGVVGVFSTPQNSGWTATSIFKSLDERRVPHPEEEEDTGSTNQEKIAEMSESDSFKKKIDFWNKKMEKEGRPVGDKLTPEERHRQAVEFAQWSCTAQPDEYDEDACKIEEVDDCEEVDESEDA